MLSQLPVRLRSSLSHPSRYRRRRLLLEALEDRCLLATNLLFDINTTTHDADPKHITNVNGTIFFSATTPEHGRELWKTDGTPAGTMMMMDINPGPADGISVVDDHVPIFAALGNTLLFVGRTPTQGFELWKSDGTPAGTVLVRNIAPGSFSSYPEWLTAFNGFVYFQAVGQDSEGVELWRSDGTMAGTTLFADIAPLSFGSSYPMWFTVMGGWLYFNAQPQATGSELYRTNGLPGSTQIVHDIVPGTTGSIPIWLRAAGTTLYFLANGPGTGRELWKSDGTAAGTTIVRDIVTGTGTPFPNHTSNPYLTPLGTTLYFVCNDGVNGFELWKTDGTSPGTTIVRNINPGAANGILENAGMLTALGSMVYFVANDGPSGTELWRSNGTLAGTEIVLNIAPGVASGVRWESGGYLANAGGTLYFNGVGPGTGEELWKSDGTAAGTAIVRDLVTGGSSSPLRIRAVGTSVFFSATTPLHGRELWKSNGTFAGTLLTGDANAATKDAAPDHLTVIDSILYFTADDGVSGRELWRTDGTAAGTFRVRDINPNGSAFPMGSTISMVNFNGTLYFNATDGSSGIELWKSDGTVAGTTIVRDIQTGSGGSNPGKLTPAGSLLFFTATTSAAGNELWMTDGTLAGTAMVADINPGSPASSPDYLTNNYGYLFFTAIGPGAGRELWVSDGISFTFQMADIRPGAMPSNPRDLVEVYGYLYFTADDGTHGRELWVCDWTPEGTVMVKDINPGAPSAFPTTGTSPLTNVNGLINFAANDGTNGTELWLFDWGPSGPYMMKDIRSGPMGSNPTNMFNQYGYLFFAAADAAAGNELWISDGTADGTTLLANIAPGTGSSNPAFFTDVAYYVLFAAGPAMDRELWITDWTTPGTFRVADIYPGASGSNPGTPSGMVYLNNVLIFAATNPLYGRELWASDPFSPAPHSPLPDAPPTDILPWNAVVIALSGNEAVFAVEVITRAGVTNERGDDPRIEYWTRVGDLDDAPFSHRSGNGADVMPLEILPAPFTERRLNEFALAGVF